ncbi:hypothetical protein [Sphingosinicella sp. BN140058]|uniref:hypothetical protein n=1 Tax=Sphingosinicella sp. BN140058 TaxID=1892855 RepID=UPI0010111F04|nr:hypothetical protein [Sphingosinicella sp. BN140058]QAY75242.1 hypothetical protein ETR14_00855 [Sphingosinicella sp. BN140058]
MVRFATCFLVCLAIGGAAPLAAQGAEAQAKLERAGRLASMASDAGDRGDRIAQIGFYQKSLKLLNDVVATSPAPSAEVVFGRREIQLSLGDAFLADKKPKAAADVFGPMAEEISGPAGAIPADRSARLHLARALRGLWHSAFLAGDYGRARATLPRLIAVGRAMQVEEPTNSYLTRRLAEDLQGETFFRWLLQDGAGSRDTARETLALFRSLAEANPGSEEAMRSHFLWAYGAAELQHDDIVLWREALAVGEQLEARKAMKAEHQTYLGIARAHVARAGG